MTGIEGTYRRTSESVLNVLRRNKDSLMAVLEAFVYDPLLNWRLMDTAPKAKVVRTKTGEPESVASSQETTEFLEEGLSVSAAIGKKSLPSSSLENNPGMLKLTL